MQDDEPPPENEQMNDKGLVVVNDDNIVSEKEDFAEEEDHEEEIHANENDDAPTAVAESDALAVVVELDDQTERESYSMPRRENAGTGVDRIQMCLDSKIYGTKRTKMQYNFVTNGRFLRKNKSNKKKLKNKDNKERKKNKKERKIKKVDTTMKHVDRTKTLMSYACDVIFAQSRELNDTNRHNQMTAKAGFRKIGQETVAEIVKKITQLNEGAVTGNHVAIPQMQQ